MKVGSFQGKIDLGSSFKAFPKGDQAIGELIKAFLEFAFIESLNILPVKSFNFLLTTRLEGDVFYFGLTCHIEPFYKSYKELLSLFFTNQKAWQDRVRNLPKVADLKCNLGFGDSVPHRVTLTERNIIDIRCVQQSLYKIEFPISTSTLLLLISAVIQGKIINFDNINVGKRESKEVTLMKLLTDVQKHKRHLQINDFDISPSNPENWRLSR